MRGVTIILAASGWGAANFATADGALTVSQQQLLKPILNHPDIHAEIYFANWHLNSHQKSSDYSVDQRRTHVLHVGNWLSRIVEIAASKNHFVLVIGGDHSIAMGTWSGLKNADKDFGLIWIDAHMDAHTYETSISKNPHGMPVAALLGVGDGEFVKLAKNPPVLKPASLIQTGIRSYEEEEQEFLEQLGVDISYHYKRHSYNGLDSLTKSKQCLLQIHPYYGVSFDIDGIDPAYCPGTGTPADGGLELNDVIQSLKGILFYTSCIGLEIVEYNPVSDHEQITFESVKKIIASLVA
jgi:arginase